MTSATPMTSGTRLQTFCLRSSATAVYTDVQAFLHAMNGRVSTFCAKTWEAQRRFWRSRRSSGLLRKIPRSCPLCSREVHPEKMAPTGPPRSTDRLPNQGQPGECFSAFTAFRIYLLVSRRSSKPASKDAYFTSEKKRH